jgi:PAS domain S-box-containing protein
MRKTPLAVRRPREGEDPRLSLFLKIVEAIGGAEDFNSAVEVALREVCRATGWDYAEAWIPAPDGSALECSPAWCQCTEGVEEFRTVSEGFTFAPGVGLPGRVWASKQPEWVEDMSAEPVEVCPRAEIALKTSLKAALGVPIVAGEQVLAVLVFFSSEFRRENERHVAIAATVAAQLGSMLRRKQAEQALREHDAFLQAIIDESTSVIYLKDREGRYLFINREYDQLFHISREQIKGKTDYDLFPKEMADAFRANDRRVLESGVPLEFEERVPQDDGIHIYISNKFPMRDLAGVPYGVCGISTDITERKRIEETEVTERERAETWFRSIIETTQDAVISIDRQGRIVLFNPSAERIFGYAKAEVQGKKVNLLMAEPYASEHENYTACYESTGEQRAIGRIRTVAGRRKNGEVFPIELSVTVVTTQGDARYAAFIRDVSEKTRLQNQLIESERLAAVGATAAKLAHEIGNPLNGMSMTAQLLERHLTRQREVVGEPAKSTLRRLMDEISRLSNLVREFSSLSRREKYSFRPTSLPALIEKVLQFEMTQYAALGIRVERAFPEDLLPVYADSGRLKQAILNLLKNAAEAMPRGGTLTLRAHNSGEQVVLEIVDTGLGIPDGVDIFEPFATTKESGTGLGLVIVRQIISAHGGTISYSSERGKGTVFRLTLPLRPSPQPAL